MTFRFASAACTLAKVIYYARADAFKLDGCAWEALTPHEKAIYVEQAQSVLEANRPIPTHASLFDDFVAETRAHAARVVGRIDPDPDPDLWGV